MDTMKNNDEKVAALNHLVTQLVNAKVAYSSVLKKIGLSTVVAFVADNGNNRLTGLGQTLQDASIAFRRFADKMRTDITIPEGLIPNPRTKDLLDEVRTHGRVTWRGMHSAEDYQTLKEMGEIAAANNGRVIELIGQSAATQVNVQTDFERPGDFLYIANV